MKRMEKRCRRAIDSVAGWREWRVAAACLSASLVVIFGNGDDVGWKSCPKSRSGAYRGQGHPQEQQHVSTGRWCSPSASQPVSPVQVAKSNSAAGFSSHPSYYLSSVDHRHYLYHHQQHRLVPTTPFDVDSSSRTHAPSSAASGSGNDLDPIKPHYIARRILRRS
ncbi:hypothetical protein CPC08DRAFT_193535 [Agrocybe pediades]|nr:hypothetical protein CPC08DRAFT_193535 [Agrocybe pediades]